MDSKILSKESDGYRIIRNLLAYIALLVTMPITIIIAIIILTIETYRSFDGSSTIHFPWEMWKDMKDEL